MEQQQGNARYLCSPHTFHMWENGREVPWVGCFCWALQVAWFLGVWGYRLKNSTRVTLAIIREHVTTYVMRKTWGYFMIWFSLKFYQCFLNVFPRFFDLGTSQICILQNVSKSKKSEAIYVYFQMKYEFGFSCQNSTLECIICDFVHFRQRICIEITLFWWLTNQKLLLSEFE